MVQLDSRPVGPAFEFSYSGFEIQAQVDSPKLAGGIEAAADPTTSGQSLIVNLLVPGTDVAETPCFKSALTTLEHLVSAPG